MSKENHQSQSFINMINNTPSNFLLNEEESLEYLLFLNRTYWNNLATVDIIDYEKLIYIELNFPNNYEIQNLISIIKENIYKNYKYKNKLLSRILDNNIFNNNKLYFNQVKHTYFMDNIKSVNTIHREEKEVRK